MHKNERREHLRVEFSGTFQFASCSSLETHAEDIQPKGEGSAVDLSESGLCLVTNDSLKDANILRVNIPVPGLSLSIPTLARVIWEEPYRDAYKVGMKFIV